MPEHRTWLRLLPAAPVLALTVVAVATPAGAAPRLTLDPDHARVGAAVTVVGSGFPQPVDDTVGCLLTERGKAVGSCSPEGKGRISGSFDAVGDIGLHTITASYGTGSAVATLVVVTDTTVPDLRGLDGRAAVAAIEQAGLVACRPVIPDGTVVSQTPPADTVVLTGSCVVPVLEPAPTKTDDRVPVPDVVGRTAGDARSTLATAGLTSTLTGGGGRVVDQSPDAGIRVSRGTAVRLRTAALPTLVAVPDVTGGDVRAARGLLGAVGLALAGNPADEAQVTDQEPAAGTEVPPGTAVAVTLDPAGPVASGGSDGSNDASDSSGSGGAAGRLLLVAAAGVLLAVLAVTAGRLRRRAGPARRAPVLRLTASADLSLDVAVRASSRAAGLPLRLVPVPDGTHIPELLEVR